MNTKTTLSQAEASRRYQTQAVIGLVFFIILVSVIAGPARETLVGNGRTALILLPMLPLAWFFWAFIQYLGRADELVRRVHIEALAVAAGATSFLALGYGLLEALARFPRLELWWVFVAVGLIWSLAGFILWRRYR